MWSDSGEPAQKVTGGTPVINGLVLGLPFSTAIFRTLPIKIMRKIVGLKFDQNDSIRDRLIGLAGHLYEATKADLDFACGMTLSQIKDICQDNITGKNMLGIILEEYRDNILG